MLQKINKYHGKTTVYQIDNVIVMISPQWLNVFRGVMCYKTAYVKILKFGHFFFFSYNFIRVDIDRMISILVCLDFTSNFVLQLVFPIPINNTHPMMP